MYISLLNEECFSIKKNSEYSLSNLIIWLYYLPISIMNLWLLNWKALLSGVFLVSAEVRDILKALLEIVSYL